MAEKEILVSARNLVKSFKVKNGTVKAVGGVDLDIYKGETLALVGESGCGKSTFVRKGLKKCDLSNPEMLTVVVRSGDDNREVHCKCALKDQFITTRPAQIDWLNQRGSRRP